MPWTWHCISDRSFYLLRTSSLSRRPNVGGILLENLLLSSSLIARNKSNHYISPSQKESRKTTSRIQGHQPYRCMSCISDLKIWIGMEPDKWLWQEKKGTSSSNHNGGIAKSSDNQTSRDMSWNVLTSALHVRLSKPGSVPLNTGSYPVSKLLAKSSQYKSGIPPSDDEMEPWKLLLFRDL